ncbi:hypothetical protein V7S43_003484 [Phytophthora oleae]|uniref:Uncharacterized protein n=1 Tax=Phytophthora oleae TaxID=2107226 RepID=A0ABD3FXB2_9STRA
MRARSAQIPSARVGRRHSVCKIHSSHLSPIPAANVLSERVAAISSSLHFFLLPQHPSSGEFVFRVSATGCKASLMSSLLWMTPMAPRHLYAAAKLVLSPLENFMVKSVTCEILSFRTPKSGQNICLSL